MHALTQFLIGGAAIIGWFLACLWVDEKTGWSGPLIFMTPGVLALIGFTLYLLVTAGH